jgi:prepilin-type N-terminal cleavage/methylation domain-containing protein
MSSFINANVAVSKKNCSRIKRGITLIEILISLAVLGVVMPSAGITLYSLFRDWNRQKAYIQCITNAQWAVETMAREIREAETFTIQTSSPGIWRARLESPTLGQYIWYWGGDQTFANESTKYGYTGALYRAVNANFCTLFCVIPNAFNERHSLTGYVVDNPDLVNNATGLPPADGTADPLVIDNGSGLITITLTVRPKPDSPVGRDNRNYTISTQVRTRND